MATEVCQVWVSKYAITVGIYETKAYVYNEGDAKTIDNRTYLKLGDWWLTKEGAIQKAETMRKDRIASLRRQIRRLKDMNFEEPNPNDQDQG